MGYVYAIKNLINNKLYIGQTRYSIKRRWAKHVSSFNQYKKGKKHGTSKLLCDEFDKYTLENFSIIKLFECDDNLLNEKEKSCIKIFNTLHPNGYNILKGGFSFNDDIKKKMSDAKSGNRSILYGVPKSEEFKKMISKIKSGKNHHYYGKTLTDEHKKKLSIAHKSEKGLGLPMYISYVSERPHCYQGSGYVVLYPNHKKKYFTSKKLKMEEKMEMAKLHLEKLKNS